MISGKSEIGMTMKLDLQLAQTALRHLRIAALIEGSTLAVLVCIAVPMKHLAGMKAATAIAGPIHGVAFIAYIWLVASTIPVLRWSRWDLARLLVPALIPFGTFFNIGLLRRRAAALEGSP